MTSDEQLILELQQGSDEAFTELFLRYRERVYGFFRRRMNDAAQAEELAQETFWPFFGQPKGTNLELRFAPIYLASLSTFSRRIDANQVSIQRSQIERRTNLRILQAQIRRM